MNNSNSFSSIDVYKRQEYKQIIRIFVDPYLRELLIRNKKDQMETVENKYITLSLIHIFPDTFVYTCCFYYTTILSNITFQYGQSAVFAVSMFQVTNTSVCTVLIQFLIVDVYKRQQLQQSATFRFRVIDGAPRLTFHDNQVVNYYQ